MKIHRVIALALTLCLAPPVVAAAVPTALAAPCMPGASYDPTCDADHNGVINVLDVQLTAGHWNQSGTYTGDGWSLTGNAGTMPGTNFIGTTDNQPLEVKVNGQRVLRVEPGTNGPNLIGGIALNEVAIGVTGATIAGGGQSSEMNLVTDSWGTVGGGSGNQAGNSGSISDATYATVAGGLGNGAAAYMATVAGGSGNTASGQYSFVGGGISNEAESTHAVVTGGSNNSAGGSFAVVPGGYLNSAAGWYSYAAGRRAKANHTGAFVLADSSDFDLASTTANSLRARFTGGMRMIVGIDASGDYTVNCLLSQATGSWSCSSSLAAMENVQTADGRDILDRLSQLPVLTWQAGAEGVRHIGPAEQDFHAAFGLGQPGEGISTIDLDGVALASIQALYQMVQEKDAQLATQQVQIDDLAARLAALEQGASSAP